MHPLIRRPILTVLVAVFLVIGFVPQGASATTNVLGRDCNPHDNLPGVKTSCVFSPKGPDDTGRTMRFRDNHGKVITIKHRAAAWKYVTAHSHKCNGYQHACYFTDPIAGQSVAMPSGLSISLRRLPR